MTEFKTIPETNNIFRKPIKYKILGECWVCVSHRKSKNGLGQRQVRRDGQTKSVRRHVYEIYHGSLYEGQSIVSKCGNSDCINPDHVYVQ